MVMFDIAVIGYCWFW